MNDPIETYTYRDGEKLGLTRATDMFMAAAPADVLNANGFAGLEQVSPVSNRVTVGAAELDAAMASARRIAAIHHAYTISGTRQEFLISDRIFVYFREDTATSEIDALMERYGLLLVEAYPNCDYLLRLTDRSGVDPVKIIRELVEEEVIVDAADHDLNYRLRKNDSQASVAMHYPSNEEDLQGSIEDSELVMAVTGYGRLLSPIGMHSAERIVGWAYWESYPGIPAPRLVTNDNLGADASTLFGRGQSRDVEEANTLLFDGDASGPQLLPIEFEREGDFYFTSDSQIYDTLRYVGEAADVFVNPWDKAVLKLFAPIVKRLIDDLLVSGGRSGNGLLFVAAASNHNGLTLLDRYAAMRGEKQSPMRGDAFGLWRSHIGDGRGDAVLLAERPY